MDNMGVGKKFFHCGAGSTCEFHGEDKTSWTFLDDHLFRKNQVVEPRTFDYTLHNNNNDWVWSGIGFHRFSNFGAWKDGNFWHVRGGNSQDNFLNNMETLCDVDSCDEDILVMFSVGQWIPGPYWAQKWSLEEINPDLTNWLSDNTNFFEQNEIRNHHIDGCQFITVKYKNQVTQFACDQLLDESGENPIQKFFEFDLQGTKFEISKFSLSV